MLETPSVRPLHQSTLTAVELSLKDGLRTLGFNLHLGAHWLVEDVAPRLAQQIDPTGISGTRETLHGLVGSAARGTLSTLESVQQRAASTALADEPYRTLDFTLQPLASYFSAPDQRNPSGLFADVFYWLLRHALAMQAQPSAQRALVRQRAVDAAYWIVQSGRIRHAAQAATATATATATDDRLHDAQDHASLCAQLLRALVATQPVRDATLLPWAQADASAAGSSPWLQLLLGVVLAAGSIRDGDGNRASAAARLRLGQQLATARRTAFAHALAQGPGDGWASLTAEFAFVLRHL